MPLQRGLQGAEGAIPVVPLQVDLPHSGELAGADPGCPFRQSISANIDVSPRKEPDSRATEITGL